MRELTIARARLELLNSGLDEHMVNRFCAYIREHRSVWLKFQNYALQLIDSGQTTIGAKKIFEDLRYDPELEKQMGKFKAPNEFTAYFARLFILKFPEHSGKFILKPCKVSNPQVGAESFQY